MATISKIQLPSGTTYNLKDSEVRGTVQDDNMTLSSMNSYDVGTAKTGYVENIAGVTGYVTVRTYSEPGDRKMQILESQDGTYLTRYYNGLTWTTFQNSLSTRLDEVSNVVNSILSHGSNSWDTIQTIVRNGLGPEYYPVGSLLYDNMDENTGVAFRVVGYDNFFDETLTAQGYNHSMTLLEEKLNYVDMQFDAVEAFLYVENNPLPAGDYRFTIPNYDSTYGGNQTYEFTADAEVPVGGQITLSWAYQQQPASVSAYSGPTSTTALFTASSSNSKFGVWDGTGNPTDLGTIKLAMSDPDSTYGQLNHIHRARYGSNNYYQSGMRQWLNSDLTSNWWEPKTVFDRPYSNRGTAGRLTTLAATMVSKLATPTITCITNNIFETGNGPTGSPFALNTQYTVKDKLFLVSQTEVGFGDSPVIGSALAYYVGAANSKRIKYRTNGNAQHWWLRPPYPAGAYSERSVLTSGALDGLTAYRSYGAAAACIIQ